MIREVPTRATVTIDHRPYYVRAWRDGFLAADRAGTATLLDRELRVTGRRDLGADLADVTVADDGEPAWVTGDGACRWHGGRLWVAQARGDDVLVRVGDREVAVPDPFGEAMPMLLAHPDDDRVVLWVAAGQDGQQTWLLTDDGAAVRAEHLPPDDHAPALFGPDGAWYLVVDDEALRRVAWPGGTELASLPWVESGAPGLNVQLLLGGRAFWSGEEGRIHVIDLATMTAVDEITLAGHPIRPTFELYPGLADDDTPCTDLQFAIAAPGGTILSVHLENTLVLSRAADWAGQAAGSIA
jgi:hypothetical protein